MTSIIQFFLQDRSPLCREFNIRSKAELPALSVQLMDAENSPANLTSATAEFVMKTEGGVKMVSAAASMDDPVNGIVSFTFSTSHLIHVARHYGEFKITMKTGKKYVIPDGVSQSLIINVGSSL